MCARRGDSARLHQTDNACVCCLATPHITPTHWNEPGVAPQEARRLEELDAVRIGAGEHQLPTANEPIHNNGVNNEA